MQEINEILDENKRLKQQNLELRTKLEKHATSRRNIIAALAKIVFGRNLSESTRTLVHELVEKKKVNKSALGDFVLYLIRRVSRVGIFIILPTILLGIQILLLVNQNKYINTQNLFIKEQTVLNEANRRSSLIVYLNDIFNRIDSELQSNESHRLSNALVGRIVAVSSNLRPYQFLENGQIIEKPLSPERGQLFQGLINSGINKESLEKVFSLADFRYADLRGVNLSDRTIPKTNLSFADLSGGDYRKATFSQVNLEGANMKQTVLYLSQFKNCNLNLVHFDGAILDYCSFEACEVSKISAKNTSLTGISFQKSFADDPTWLQDKNLKNIKIEKYSEKQLSSFHEATGTWFREERHTFRIDNIALKGK